MSTRYHLANMLKKIYGSLESASGHDWKFRDEIESWERSWITAGQEENYKIRRAIEGLFMVKLDLDKARDACFWLELELMDGGEV